jgi:sugar phosphate permease
LAANTAPMADAAPAAIRRSRVRWLILLLIGVMYMITYLDRANISVTAPAMAAEFALSKTETGWIFSAFAWAYALGQIPGGFLADRLGPKRVLLLIVPFWSVMTAATAWASSALTLFAVRFVFGLGEAGAFPAATRAMQLWFPKQERGLVQGVTHCFSRLAVAATPAIAIAIMTALGWRWVFYVFASLGVGWSVWFAIAYRNRPEEHHRVNPGELAHIREAAVASPARGATAVPWKAIVRAPNMWAISAAYFCFFYGSYFYLTWFPTYLIEYRHLSLKDAGLLASVPLIAAMAGDLVGGLFTDALLRKTGRLTWSRRMVAAPALLGAAAFLIPAALAHAVATAIICLTVSNFCLEMVLGPAWAIPMDVAGVYSGTVAAIMNMAGAVGASISPLVFATLVERGSWIAPFVVTAGLLVIGALIWSFLIDADKPLIQELPSAS